MMLLFDLHCDTIVSLKDNGEDFRNASTQFSLRNLEQFERICQTMAVFIPDEIRGPAALNYFKSYYQYLLELLERQSDIVAFARNTEEIAAAAGAGKCAVLLAVESGAVLAGREETITYLADCGVSILTLTWNGENELASGHGTGRGFSAFGRRAVKALVKAGILLDVSHLNDRGFDELCEMTETPFLATHSNLRSVCPHQRNLTDSQFKEITRRKGLVGINLYERFLSEAGEGTKEQLFTHIYKMLELGGENIIACGSDFDGAAIHPSLNSPVKLARTAEYFSQMGLSDQTIQHIFYENAFSFFERTLK